MNRLACLMLVVGSWCIASFDDYMDKRFDLVDEAKMQHYFGKSARQMYTYCAWIYDISYRNKDVRVKIPKVFHHIWVGGSVPEKLERFRQTWLKHHPDWQFKLWTDKEIAQLSLFNREYVSKSRNPGEISDLVRYEILYQEGGVYVDFDFECLRPIDDVHEAYDFYLGIQPFDSGLVQLGTGLIGSIPGHPLLKKIIEGVAERWKLDEFVGNPAGRTGPVYVTKLFSESAHCYKHVVALPVNILYPLACNDTEVCPDEWLRRGAYAVHHWAKTWLKPAFRRSQFRELY